MSQEHLSSPNGTHEGDTPGERVTLSVPIHLATPTRRTVVREGPKPARLAGRVPRVARILAQAHHFQNLIDMGVVRTQMELAELTKLTTARITQIMNLLVLAPDIQEEILFMPPVAKGPAPVTERDLRPLLKTLVWSEQRQRWAELRTVGVIDESRARDADPIHPGAGLSTALVQDPLGTRGCAAGPRHVADTNRTEFLKLRARETAVLGLDAHDRVPAEGRNHDAYPQASVTPRIVEAPVECEASTKSA